MNSSTELLVLVFTDETQADEVLKVLRRLINEGQISVLDAAVLAKCRDGRTAVKDIQEVGARQGTLFGAIAGGLIGLAGGPVGVLIGALAGATTGGVAAHAIDSGFPDDYLQELQANLSPGRSALIVLSRHEWSDRVIEALAQFQGRLIRHILKDELAAYLAALAVLDNDQIPATELAAKLETQIAAWQAGIEDLKAELAVSGSAETRNRLVTLRTKQRRVQEKLHELWQAEIEAMTGQIDALRVKVDATPSKARVKLLTQLEAIRSKRRAVREKLYAQIEARIQSWQEEIVELQARVAEIEASVGTPISPRLAALQRFASVFDEPVLPTAEVEAKARITALQTRVETAEMELQNLYETQIATWQTTIRDLQTYEMITGVADKAEVRERITVLQEQVGLVQAKLKTHLEAQITGWQVEINELQAQVAVVTARAKTNTQIAALQAQIAQLQAQAALADSVDMVRVTERVAALQAKVAAAQAKLPM
ncbi:MAG: hypothetical protein BroJett011_46390 [Chloroflexota bacterium]|nr:MAG: hypothetical protein BroJett011_46390 [Chloroflexota bacterium]